MELFLSLAFLHDFSHTSFCGVSISMILCGDYPTSRRMMQSQVTMHYAVFFYLESHECAG